VHSRYLSGPAAALGLALALYAGPSLAHGGLFRTDELRVDPADSSHLIVRSDVWGIVETHDEGKNWQWTCAAAVFGDDLTVLREPLTILPHGTVFIGSTRYGLARSRGSLCDLEVVSFFQDGGHCAGGLPCVPFDVASESPASDAVVVLTNVTMGGGKFSNALWRSADAGDSWASMSTAVPVDVFATALAVAPSDSATVYVGSSNTTTSFYLHRSTDGGQTFAQTELPVQLSASEPAARFRFYGVHPTDPNIVFVWLDADDGLALAPDRMFVSFDGGASITLAYTSKNDLPGFAISPDGSTVFVGGTDEGLWSATVSDLRAGTADAFHQVNSEATWSLAFTDRGLYAGRQEFPVDAGVPPMTLGVSTDQGRTFQSALALCDVQLADCAKETRAGGLCPGLYYGDYNFQYDQQRLHCAAGPKPTGDGGTKPTPPPSSDGGCRTAKGPGRGSSGPIAAAVALLAAGARRSRRALAGRLRRRNRRTS
jgi:hypothetical protein